MSSADYSLADYSLVLAILIFMKMKSYLLIFALAIILVFILGIRYGQSVEKTNKIVDYVMSITPTPSPKPPAPVEYKTYENKACGLTFLTPNTFTLQNISSKSAKFVENKIDVLTVDCNSQSQVINLYADPKTATGEVMFKDRKLPIKQTDTNTDILKLYNPQNNKYVYITIQKELYPLFESSVNFTL